MKDKAALALYKQGYEDLTEKKVEARKEQQNVSKKAVNAASFYKEKLEEGREGILGKMQEDNEARPSAPRLK